MSYVWIVGVFVCLLGLCCVGFYLWFFWFFLCGLLSAESFDVVVLVCVVCFSLSWFLCLFWVWLFGECFFCYKCDLCCFCMWSFFSFVLSLPSFLRCCVFLFLLCFGFLGVCWASLCLWFVRLFG